MTSSTEILEMLLSIVSISSELNALSESDTRSEVDASPKLDVLSESDTPPESDASPESDAPESDASEELASEWKPSEWEPPESEASESDKFSSSQSLDHNLPTKESQSTSGKELADIKVSSESEPGPLTSFTKFSSLPGELRRMIWVLVAHQPRILLLYPKIDPDKGSSDLYLNSCLSADYRCSIPIYASLQVNHESRTEVMPYLTVIFRNIYINPVSDTIVPNSSLEDVFYDQYVQGINPPMAILPRRKTSKRSRAQKLAEEISKNFALIKHFGLLNTTGAFSWDKPGRAKRRRDFLSHLPALESVTFLLGKWSVHDTELAKWDWEDIDKRTDPIGFFEQKGLVQATKDDYDTYLNWTAKSDEQKEVIEAQMERLGGNGPAVKVYRYTPDRR